MHRRDDQDHDPFYQVPNEVNEQEDTTETIAERAQRKYDEEFATEFTEPIQEDNTASEQFNQVFGWIAVVLSIISFFMAPLFFAVAGIILGIIARNRHATLLGYSAIVIAIVSLITQILIIPMVR